MKLILFVVFALVLLWCCFGCGDIGGGRSVDPNNTHQIDTLPDSLRVKDTVINDIEKRKSGQ